MPLKIQLRPKERIIINGAVIEGHPDGRTEITVMNKATIMRQKHIIQESEANTPAKRLYFALQMMYIDPDNKDDYKKSFDTYLKDLKETVTLDPLKKSLSLIEEAEKNGKFYESMKICRDLIKVEEELLNLTPSKLSQE